MRTTPPTASPTPATGPIAPAHFTVHWDQRSNEQGDPLLWFGSWLLAPRDPAAAPDPSPAQEAEGDAFYSGRGGETTAHPVPSEAVGARIRCWPSEALEAEYVDLPLTTSGAPLEFYTASLTFDTAQPHSHLELPKRREATMEPR